MKKIRMHRQVYNVFKYLFVYIYYYCSFLSLISLERKTLAGERKTMAPERKTMAQERKTMAGERKTMAAGSIFFENSYFFTL